MSIRMFACAGCGRIVRGRHAHAITCSTACRVRLYRHADIRARLVEQAHAAGLPVSDLLERKAFVRLYPDLAELVRVHKISIEDARWQALRRALLAAAYRTAQTPPRA